MTILARLALVALSSVSPALAAAPLPAPGAPGGAPITWKGRALKLDELPGDLGDAPRRALTEWAEFAAEHDYRCDLDPQGRVLLLGPRKGWNAEAALKLVAKTEAWFDGLLPAPTQVEPAPTVAGGAGAPGSSAGAGGGSIPEDPEAPPPGAPATRGTPGTTGTTKAPGTEGWGSGSLTPDSRTAVMFVVPDEAAFGILVDALLAKRSYLAEWAAKARTQPGFVLEDPLCGAYVQNARGQEEWSPEHELVHRVAQLLLLRRFGQQPYWLTLAVGWEAEYVHDGTHYCYPYRDEFVWAAEHGAWPADLENEFKERVEKPLELSEVTAWRRGKFEVGPARKAWGTFHYASRAQAAKLSGLFADLARFRTQYDRRSTGPGTWERIPGYEIPDTEQVRLVNQHLGADFCGAASEAFRKGLKTLKVPPPAKSAPPARTADRR